MIAIRDAQQLRVFRRQRWKDFDGQWTIERFVNLALDAQFEQLELAANYMREFPRIRRSFGQLFFRDIASSIGERWALLEMGKLESEDEAASKSTLSKLDHWKAQGSDLAILASGFRHKAIASKARGTGYANTVSQAGFKTHDDRYQLALAEVQPILNRETPPDGALWLAIRSRLSLGESAENLQPLLKKQIECHPYSYDVHAQLCLHMLPRWGGRSGEAGSYLGSLTDLLPYPFSELTYTRVLLVFYKSLGPSILLPHEAGMSISRVMRSIEPLLESNSLDPREIEMLIALICTSNRLDLAQMLANYHVRHFTFTQLAITGKAAEILATARREMR